MKLELKHLAAYLPYGLKLYDEVDKKAIDLISLHFSKEDGEQLEFYAHDEIPNSDWLPIDALKPILRPMSDLKFMSNLINEYCLKFYDGEWCSVEYAEYGESPKAYVPLNCPLWIFENHFDLFNLIEQGLAIDINSLK